MQDPIERLPSCLLTDLEPVMQPSVRLAAEPLLSAGERIAADQAPSGAKLRKLPYLAKLRSARHGFAVRTPHIWRSGTTEATGFLAGETGELPKAGIVLSISFLRAVRDLIRAIGEVVRDPQTRALPVVAGVLILSGTIFYWRTEGWSVVEAFYFSVITLTTVGYGDLTPTTPGTQIFTVVYVLIGIGVLVALLTSVAQAYIKQKAEAPSTRERLKAYRQHRQTD
jgi:hypothetical protein